MTTRSVAAFALALFLGLCAPGTARSSLEIGQPIPDFTLTALDGKIVQMSRTHGAKGTVIVFWASWSPRSTEALSALQALYEEHGATGDLQVIAVNVEHETWSSGEFEEVVGYIQAKNLSFPIVFDMDLTLYEQYGVTVVPFMVLTDAEGKTVTQLAGYPERMRKYFYNDLGTTIGTTPEPGEDT